MSACAEVVLRPSAPTARKPAPRLALRPVSMSAPCSCFIVFLYIKPVWGAPPPWITSGGVAAQRPRRRGVPPLLEPTRPASPSSHPPRGYAPRPRCGLTSYPGPQRGRDWPPVAAQPPATHRTPGRFKDREGKRQPLGSTARERGGLSGSARQAEPTGRKRPPAGAKTRTNQPRAVRKRPSRRFSRVSVETAPKRSRNTTAAKKRLQERGSACACSCPASRARGPPRR